jgi:hypothetical protein
MDEIIDAEGLEEQDHVPEVHALYLGDRVLLQLVLVRPRRVQPTGYRLIIPGYTTVYFQ